MTIQAAIKAVEACVKEAECEFRRNSSKSFKELKQLTLDSIDRLCREHILPLSVAVESRVKTLCEYGTAGACWSRGRLLVAHKHVSSAAILFSVPMDDSIVELEAVGFLRRGCAAELTVITYKQTHKASPEDNGFRDYKSAFFSYEGYEVRCEYWAPGEKSARKYQAITSSRELTIFFRAFLTEVRTALRVLYALVSS